MTIRLTDPSADRYQRLRLIRWWDQDRLKKSRALVVGAGAVGNEVVKNLALLGVGHVWIADFDTVETSNLTRSALFRQQDVGRKKAEVLAERARDMNPDCTFYAMYCDVRFELGLGFFWDLDLVFGCLDNREARYFVNRSCYLTRKLYLDGGLDTLNGSVSVFQAPLTACYECTLNSTDRSELRKRISCLKSTDPEIKQHVPTAPTIASLVAALQVQIAVRYLHGLPIPSGKRLGLYGLSDLFFDIKLAISEECGLHSSFDPLPDSIEKLEISIDAPLAQVLRLAADRWKAEALTWDFDRDLIVGLRCAECGEQQTFEGTTVLYRESSVCRCGGIFKPETTTQYTGLEKWGEKNFLQLGFPRQHIYSARVEKGRKYFRMIE